MGRSRGTREGVRTVEVQLRGIAEGRLDIESLGFGAGDLVVDDVLRDIAGRDEHLARTIYDDDGTARRSFRVLVNGSVAPAAQELSDGDLVVIAGVFTCDG